MNTDEVFYFTLQFTIINCSIFKKKKRKNEKKIEGKKEENV